MIGLKYCQTKNASKSSKLNQSWQLKVAHKKLNVSRNLLQRSVGPTKRVDLLQLNNSALAKKVCELQSELSIKNTELQAKEAEIFKLHIKLNHLNNANTLNDISLLNSKINIIMDATYQAHQIVQHMSGVISPMDDSLTLNQHNSQTVPSKESGLLTSNNDNDDMLVSLNIESQSLVANPPISSPKPSLDVIEMDISSNSTKLTPKQTITNETTNSQPVVSKSVYNLDSSIDHCHLNSTTTEVLKVVKVPEQPTSKPSKPHSRSEHLSVRFDIQSEPKKITEKTSFKGKKTKTKKRRKLLRPNLSVDEIDIDSEKENENVNLKKNQTRFGGMTKFRKHIKQIDDDSVFIEIMDSTVVEKAVSNAAKDQSSPSSSPTPIDSVGNMNKIEKCTKLFDDTSVLTDIPNYTPTVMENSESTGMSRSHSDSYKPTESIKPERSRRKTELVNYMVPKINKKVRQGDPVWCKNV